MLNTASGTGREENPANILGDFFELLNAAPAAMLIIDRAGRIVAANREAHNTFGYPPQELSNKSLDLLIPEKHRGAHAGYHQQFFSDPRIRTLGRGRELTGLHRLGHEIPLEISLSPLIVNGETVGCAAICIDITERRRSEHAMRASEERYRTLVEISPDAIFVHQDQRIVFVNPGCMRLLGASSPEQILGKLQLDLIDPSFHEIVRRRMDACLTRGESTRPLLQSWIRLDGTPVEVEAAGSRFIWNGKPAVQVAARDVTERKLAEEALRRSEERYRLLFERNPQPMWVYHLATLKFLAVNQAAVDHYGYSRSEFLKMTLRDIRPPEDVPELEKSVYDASVPLDRAGIWRHLTKHGRLIHVEITEGSIEFEGKAARLVLAADVTERVQAEEKMRLQAAALESAANAIVITDATGNIQWVNPAFERLTRYSLREVVGQNPRLLQSGQHDQHFYRTMWNAILAGCTWEGELVNRRKDGSLYTEHQTITPVRDEKGTITNFVGIKEDVTEQKRAEEALRHSESEFRSIIEHAPYGIYRVNNDGTILMANPALAEMLGYNSPADLVGRNTATDVYLSPEARQESAARWAGRELVKPYEVSWKRKDGKPIQVRLAGRVMPSEAGAPPTYEVFVADITEQRSLEEQFRQAQKMEAVGRLAGGIAHDFNNLLMIISSYAELLVESGGRDATVDRYAQQIREATARAAGVTQQLLAFSRKQVLSPSVIDLNSVIIQMDKMLPRLLGEDVSIVNALGSDLGRVRVDRGQMEQIIMNLAVNARDAMPKGGKLVIETANVGVDESHARQHPTMVAGHYVVMAVSDTGIGMDKSVAAHIFEPFFTTKEAGKGTGLGLATVYGIVKQSGGFIWVYSEEGVGTCFKIYLPRVDEEPSQVAAAMAHSGTPGGNETVLIVEDEAGLRTATREFLESKGYRVIEAATGTEALRECANPSRPIHLMLTDVVMPGMGGIELAKSVATLLPEMKVIYMSGYSDRAFDVAQFRSGGVLLQKPFGLDTLAQKVRSVLDDHGGRGE